MRLFVYGTLQTYCGLSGYMHNSDIIGTRLVNGYRLFSVSGSYPVMIKGSDEDMVIGELYDVPDKDMKEIDMMELAAGYDRVSIETSSKDECFAYVGCNDAQVLSLHKPMKGPIYDWKRE